MKVAFDYQMFAAQRYGGITRYYTSLVREIALLGEEPRVFAPLHCNRYLQQLPAPFVCGRHWDRFLPEYTYFVNRLFNHWSAKLLMSLWNPQVVHETYYAMEPTGPLGVPHVITVFDMIHELFADEFPSYDKTAAAKVAAVRRADHIICISASTRDDLIRLLGIPQERTSVVHLGVDAPVDAAPVGSPGRSTSGAPFLLYVGDRRGYKNFGRLLEAVASSSSLRVDFRIVAFGSEPFSQPELQMIESLGLSKTVEHASGDDASLYSLYGGARALVYPSLYEGFGLPSLEAMARGCPVVASNTSSMPEVIGDAGELFDPSDIEAMTRAIASVVYSDDRRRALADLGRQRVRQFTWPRCAAETLAVYRRVQV
jgi:glycosyltransferase involved in cell wall biosynthesis